MLRQTASLVCPTTTTMMMMATKGEGFLGVCGGSLGGSQAYAPSCGVLERFGSSLLAPRREGRPFGSTKAETYDVGSSSNIKWHESPVTRDAREKQLNQRGCVLWMTGLSGSGKSTVAFTLEHMLQEEGKLCYVLDGDNVRHGLCQDLGFTAQCREENIRRMGEVANLMANAGIITVVSIISPFAKDRNKVRERMENKSDFHEVYMKIPVSVCEERDPKGLYKKARAGKIKGFTGIDAPYEAPENPEITLEVNDGNAAEMARELLDYLRSHKFLEY